MVIVRLRRIFGRQLQLLRQDGQQGCQVGNDIVLERREASHDALHQVLVLGWRLQFEGGE